MARRPRTGGAVATAHQGGRPQRSLRHLFWRAVALGGGPVDGFLLRPLRLLWRALPSLRSKNARRASAAAAMARRHWRADAPPRATSLLRRAVARASGAVDAALLPARRALAVLQGTLAALQRELSPSRALVVVRDWLRRLLRPRQPCQPRRVETPPPPQQQQKQKQKKKQQHRGAWYHRQRPLRPRPSTTPPPPQSPRRRIFTVDGVVVPEGVVNDYALYCRRASTCPANWSICNFCVFEIQRAERFRVRTFQMDFHCSIIMRAGLVFYAMRPGAA